MTTEPANRAASMAALLPLVRYGRRYLGRAIAALAALTISSAATLAVPFALRSMIDFGFSKESGGAINVYFLAMGALVVVIALAAATRYYLVTTLGERVVADLRRDVFAHLSRLDASFYDSARTGELVSRLTADTTQIKAAFGASASIALRNLFMFVGATALMVYTSPKLSALVLVAIPVIAAPLIASGRVVRRRSRRAQDTLAEATAFASESLGAVAHHAGLRRRGRQSGAFRRRDRKRLWRGARRRRHPFPPHCDCGFARFLQRRVRAVARRARRAGGAHERRTFVAVRAVRRAWRDVARRIVAGVERSLRRRRFGGADRRTSGRQAAHRRADEARAHAFASARRDRIQACRFLVSERARRSCPGRPQFLDRAGRTGRHRRPLRGRQVDHIPAHHALLRRRRGPGPCRWRRRQGGRSKGSARAHRAGPAGGRDLRRDGRRKHRLRARRDERVRDRRSGAASRGGRVCP